MEARYLTKDQNWQDETTIYWFELTGTDYGTGVEFDGQTFGVAESGPDSMIVNADGAPLVDGDHEEIAVRKHCLVTDELRAE